MRKGIEIMWGFFKRQARRIATPIWRLVGPGLYDRIDRRIDLRLVQLDAGWRQHAPAFLNAISTVQSLGRRVLQLQSEHERTVQIFERRISELEARISALKSRSPESSNDGVSGRRDDISAG